METNINLKHFNFKDDDAVVKVLEMTPSKIISMVTYPNGLILHFNITADEVKVKCNWSLKVEDDGSFTPIEP